MWKLTKKQYFGSIYSVRPWQVVVEDLKHTNETRIYRFRTEQEADEFIEGHRGS